MFGSTGTTGFGAAAPKPSGFGFGSTSAAAPTFGATTSAAAPTFGGFGGTTAGTSTGSFGFGSTTNTFGSSTAPVSTSSFGFGSTNPAQPSAFGAPASAAPPAFGSSFGTSTSTAPAFGSTFGTSTSAAPAFGSTFGTSTAAAPAFGGGGAFGSTFGGGSTTFGSSGNTGGGLFGGGLQTAQQQQLLQQQQQQQQLAANNPTDQLINAIMRVSMFGDDRDNLLARWNLLQASWGIGKAYFANNQQPVNLNSDNPLCRFKAIGYSAIAKPGGGNIDNDLLCIIMKKKPTEVEPLKQQLISDIQAALGNKPNFKAVINEVQQYGGDTSQIIFHIVETNMSGQTRKINANDVFNALNQPNIWPQLQQRHNLESMAPKLAFAKEQREEYLKNPPIGVDPRLWKQAQHDNPDKEALVPVPLVGFKSLQSRIKRQEHQGKIYQGRLDEIANDIAESQKKQQDNTAKLRDAKRKQLELSHRVLNIITRQEMTRKLGFTIQLEEEKLRMQLEALQSQISAPTQFKGRLNELLSQVRLQNQVTGLSGGDSKKLDQFAKEDIKGILKQQHEGIQSLVQAMKQDLSALEVMNEKLSKVKPTGNK